MTAQAAQNAQDLPAELVTFLIPITRKHLLLPNVSIAEIIHYRTPQQPDDMPTWFLGFLEWRGQQVPVVSFEALNEEPFQEGAQRQNIAIINGTEQPARLPYFALLTQGAPRLMRIAPDELTNTDDSDNCGPAELMRVSANGELASIPRLSHIELSVLELLTA